MVLKGKKAQDIVVKNKGLEKELSFPKNYENFRKNPEKSVDKHFVSC